MVGDRVGGRAEDEAPAEEAGGGMGGGGMPGMPGGMGGMPGGMPGMGGAGGDGDFNFDDMVPPLPRLLPTCQLLLSSSCPSPISSPMPMCVKAQSLSCLPLSCRTSLTPFLVT